MVFHRSKYWNFSSLYSDQKWMVSTIAMNTNCSFFKTEYELRALVNVLEGYYVFVSILFTSEEVIFTPFMSIYFVQFI